MKRDRSSAEMAIYNEMAAAGLGLPQPYPPQPYPPQGMGMQQLGMPMMGGAMPGMGMAMGGMGAGMGMAGSAEKQGESLWELLNDRMAGRWKWAIILGVILAGALGVGGFISAVPMYQSTALVKITPNVAVVVSDTPERVDLSKSVPRITATHVQLMKQARVLEQALLNDKVAKLPWASELDATAHMKENLDVQADRDSELVYLTYKSEDAHEAHVVADAVLHAYYKVCVEQDNQTTKTLTQIENLLQQSQLAMKDVSDRRNELTTKHQTPDLRELSRRNTAQIADLNDRIGLGQRLIANMKQQKQAGDQAATARAVPTPRQLEEFEPKLIGYKQEMLDAEMRFEKIKGTLQPTTQMYANLKLKWEQAKDLYEQKMQETIAAFNKAGGDPTLVRGSQFDGKSVEQIDSEIAGYRTDMEAFQKAQRDLLADILEFDKLTSKYEQLQDDLKQLGDRKQSLEREKTALAGVITIAAEATNPVLPTEDTRRKRAVMGAGLGLVASFGLFFLLGSVDRRAYGAAQLNAAAGSKVPACLGVLPDLGASISDPESSDIASHCVHQIRNQIEAVRDPRAGYALAITSPFQGDGKTSIVMALGWSYAAAGYNTLLIDCDMVGRSLTRQMGLIGREGLREAMLSKALNGSVNRMPVENLSVVPVGVDLRYGPENVRRVDLERLLSEVRGKYDMIIMDTGPMLGALESTPVTAVADGVVLSVRRGRSRAKLEECVARISLVGTSCIGVILNCAVRSDCNRYVSEASLAAAEEDRVNRPDDGSGTAIVQSIPGERNALIRAMQSTQRTREGNPPPS